MAEQTVDLMGLIGPNVAGHVSSGGSLVDELAELWVVWRVVM